MHVLLADTDGANRAADAAASGLLCDQVTLTGRIDPAAHRGIWKFRSVTPRDPRWRIRFSRDCGGTDAEPPRRGGRGVYRFEPAALCMHWCRLNGDRLQCDVGGTTRDRRSLRAGASQLALALTVRMQPGDIVIRDGAPSQTSRAPGRAFSGSGAMTSRQKTLAVALHYYPHRRAAGGRQCNCASAQDHRVGQGHGIPIEETSAGPAHCRMSISRRDSGRASTGGGEVLISCLAAVGAHPLERHPVPTMPRSLPALSTVSILPLSIAVILGSLTARLRHSEACCQCASPRSEIHDDLAKHFIDEGTAGTVVGLQRSPTI